MLKGKDLIPGKLYTFWGKNNIGSWPTFHSRPTPDSTDIATFLYPLEPFVFLTRLHSTFRQDDNEQIYDYKILTTKGYVVWLCLHDDDLEALRISFKLYKQEQA
jgi:hypothetical protein